jgi:hypothetical protein
MIKRAPRLTVALAIVGAIALGTAGPSIAHRIVSQHELQPTHRVIASAATDDNYVPLMIQATHPEW